MEEELAYLLQFTADDFINHPDKFIRLNDYHKSIFRTSICCPPELESAIERLKQYLDTIKTKPMSTSKYKLKPESLLYSVQTEKYYTEKTITDNDALFLLKNAPALIEQFSEYPDNWKEESEAFNFQDIIDEIQSQADGVPNVKSKRTKK